MTGKKEITIRFDSGTVVVAVLFLLVGFFLGSLFTISNSVPTGQAAITQPIQAPPQQQAPPQLTTVSLDDDPVIGDKNAKIRMIEFSDFQCPFCRRFWDQTLPQVKTEYIDTGKVLFVYRDFPLSFHEGAQDYAEAAECASDQGKWLEMHDKIFDEQQKQGSGTIPYPGRDTLIQWGTDIGLDANQLKQCLDSGEYKKEVQDDFSYGSTIGVSGTPTFYIGNDNIGYQEVVGAQPYSAIKQIIDQQLAKA